MRGDGLVTYFCNGKPYFERVLAAIDAAQRELFVAGWWITPDVHLHRPEGRGVDAASRLDRVIERAAGRGVKVFILMYKEIERALPHNSQFSKERFLGLHPNVHVLRDPDFIIANLGFWSHHEKLCIVDQTAAFVGGIDLCFGRYDTHAHRLDDCAAVAGNQTWPGKDYNNPRVQDFIEVNKPFADQYDRRATPRMPWRDVSCCVVGSAAVDVARHFIGRWNYALAQRRKFDRALDGGCCRALRRCARDLCCGSRACCCRGAAKQIQRTASMLPGKRGSPQSPRKGSRAASPRSPADGGDSFWPVKILQRTFSHNVILIPAHCFAIS